MIRRLCTGVGVATALATMCALGAELAAQREGEFPSRTTRPTGAEIAAAARAARLDTGNVATATMFGKPFKFTPAHVRTKTDPPNESKGLFLGVLENGAVGDETGLPPGKYNLYFANVNGKPTGYAEANGQITKEAIRTTSTPAAEGAKGKPQFNEKGWSIMVYTCDTTSLIPQFYRVYCYWKKLSF